MSPYSTVIHGPSLGLSAKYHNYATVTCVALSQSLFAVAIEDGVHDLTAQNLAELTLACMPRGGTIHRSFLFLAGVDGRADLKSPGCSQLASQLPVLSAESWPG
jgi:hypothetical protein